MEQTLALNTDQSRTIYLADPHRLESEVRYFLAQTVMNFLQVGYRLVVAQEIELWKKLGYKSFRAWLADPQGVNLGERTAYSLMRLYQVWVHKCRDVVKLEDFLAAGYSKLNKVARLIENTDDPDEIGRLVLLARDMSRSSLVDHLKLESGIPIIRAEGIMHTLAYEDGVPKEIKLDHIIIYTGEYKRDRFPNGCKVRFYVEAIK